MSVERTQEEEYPRKPGPGKGPESFAKKLVRDERGTYAPDGITTNRGGR